ncbi:MAG: hypothetical protein QOH73_73 [Gaiellaceae bacterium]|jgi:hypothetical protein|nr:hypothetical protein [Gaiellaceae bacterium]
MRNAAVVGAVRGRSHDLVSRLRPLFVEPWVPLAVLGLVQALVVVATVVRAKHDSWLFSAGGDGPSLYAAAARVGNGHLPRGTSGWVEPLLAAPLTWIAGPSYRSGLPFLVLVNLLVLLPVGLLAIYGAGARIGGRVVGYLAATVWVLAPVLSTFLFVASYHQRWTDLVVPEAIGLAGGTAFPSMVALTCASYFFLRLLDEGHDLDAALAAVLTGLAIGLRPSTAVVLVGVALGLLVARRWRGALVFAGALVPALLTLVVWRWRGPGHASLLFAVPHVDWDLAGHRLNADIREVFWSRRLLQFIPFAGVIAIARVSWTKALFVGGWLAGIYILQSPHGTVGSTSIWRVLTPAWPAFLLLLCSLPLLFPGWPARLRAIPAGPGLLRRGSRALVAALGLVALAPLVVALVLPR